MIGVKIWGRYRILTGKIYPFLRHVTTVSPRKLFGPNLASPLLIYGAVRIKSWLIRNGQKEICRGSKRIAGWNSSLIQPLISAVKLSQTYSIDTILLSEHNKKWHKPSVDAIFLLCTWMASPLLRHIRTSVLIQCWRSYFAHGNRQKVLLARFSDKVQ